jgi:hypothetical protein
VKDRLPEPQLQALVGGLPAIVWVSLEDVNEIAGVEVMMQVAYDLATKDDEDTRSIRQNILFILTPLTNPDGHARAVTWHKMYDVAGASIDPNAMENHPAWGINSDGNAYGIDVNRDFGWFVSPEIRALGREAMEWRPQFFVDIHSGPRVIFVPPFPKPYHPLWPQQAPKWWTAVAEQVNRNYAARGWSFFTRWDYVGHTQVGASRSWMMAGPAVAAFLFETFGGRPGMTMAFRRDDGTIGTMRMGMDRHYLATWSLLQVARDHREDLLRDAHERVVQAVADARANGVRAIVLPAAGTAGADWAKTARLVERLVGQGVEVRRLSQALRVRARDFYDLSTEQLREFPAGSYLVDFVQPQARLARTLLDPTLDVSHPKVEVPFGPKMPFYDVSWGNLPFLFGVHAYALREVPAVETGVVQRLTPMPVAATEPQAGGAPPYAYVLPAGQEASYRIAVRLMQNGYRLRVFHRAFRIGATEYGKGTWAALRDRNPDNLGTTLRALAGEYGGQAIPVVGPYTDGGATFGDVDALRAVPRPLVAVLSAPPVTQDHTFAGIRSVLESDFGFTFSPVSMETINGADLGKYTAVVLPHAGMDIRGGPNFDEGYHGALELDNLRRYVQRGGTLVAVKGAAAVIAGDSVLGPDIAMDGWATHAAGAIVRAEWETPPGPDSGEVVWREGLREDVGLPLLASGVQAQDFAAPAVYPILLRAREGGTAETIARYGADSTRLVLDGFVEAPDRAELAGRPFVVIQPVGRGRVIYFADDPTWRGYWYGLNLLFLNSVILGPTL